MSRPATELPRGELIPRGSNASARQKAEEKRWLREELKRRKKRGNV